MRQAPTRELGTICLIHGVDVWRIRGTTGVAVRCGAQCSSAMTVALASDASRRNMARQATRTTLFMRHGANLLVCAVVVAIPPVPQELAERVFVAALGLWSAYRLCTRSPGWRALVIDFAFTVAACLATPALVTGPQFYLSNSAPVVIAGTAVVSFTLAMPVRVSLAISLGIAGAFAVGSARVVGWSHVGDIFTCITSRCSGRRHRWSA